jgi:hypothetical protein
VSTAAGYREFRRVAIMGSALLFAAGLLLGLVYARVFGGYWIVMLWTAVAAPVVATMGLTSALVLGWAPAGISLTKQDLRASVLAWFILALLLPWIAAWFGADAAGQWFDHWWLSTSASEPGLYLWLLRLFAGLATYAVASAVGLLLTFAVDDRLASGGRRSGD